MTAYSYSPNNERLAVHLKQLKLHSVSYIYILVHDAITHSELPRNKELVLQTFETHIYFDVLIKFYTHKFTIYCKDISTLNKSCNNCVSYILNKYFKHLQFIIQFNSLYINYVSYNNCYKLNW